MANKMGTVVIGGGSGFIGSALMWRLQQKGYEVVVVSRKPGHRRITWEQLAESGLPKGCVGVVGVAGQNLLDPTRRWTAGFKQNVWASRVNTTKYLSEAIQAAAVKPRVFVSMSGVGYYPDCKEKEEVTEESAGGTGDFLTQLCTDWEAAARLPDLPDVRTVCIRSGVVLGRAGGIIQRMFPAFYLCLGGRVGLGTQPMPWVHLHDLVGLILHAMEQPTVTHVMNAVAPQVITNLEFTKAFAAALRRPAVFPLPVFALNLLFSPERAKILTAGPRVIPKVALDTGYLFKYPDIDSACRECSNLFY